MVINCHKKVTKPPDDGNNPPDTTVIPKGTMVFTMKQLGDTLGQLTLEENKHNITLQNAVHVDSILFDVISFNLRDNNPNDHFTGIEPYVFIFIQSITPGINYNNLLIIKPGLYAGLGKSTFNDIKDSTFYVEMFVCLFDTDNNNSGTYLLYYANYQTKPTLTHTDDSLLIDASQNTVVLDSALCLKNIKVTYDEFMQWYFKGQYEHRVSSVFLLTKYKSHGYENDHSGFFWDYYDPNALDSTIASIYSFWPVPPTKYKNKFGIRGYNFK